MELRRREMVEAWGEGGSPFNPLSIKICGERRALTVLFLFSFILGDLIGLSKRKAMKKVAWSFATPR